jgi:peptide-methionine (S)-S-oxide reductase
MTMMKAQALLLAPALAMLLGCARAGEIASSPLPAPAVDSAASGAGTETAVLAGGCFWGIQGVFEHVKGVNMAVSGFSGGKNPTGGYAQVSTGRTGNAETVEITYDPKQISYGQILRIYFSVMDPTELNYQGPDQGTQYRSAIFTTSAEQRRIAEAYVDQLTKAHVFQQPIVTQVVAFSAFHRAEDYHQDYLIHHPDEPYIAINDVPKVSALKQLYPQMYRETAVMVFPNRS